jgi:hypothetical protein
MSTPFLQGTMNRFAQEDGLARGLFLGVALWAVIAVYLLTGTLISANKINSSVKVVTVDVGAIDRETEQVALLTDTRSLAKGILGSTTPLAGQLDQVAASAGKIDQSAASIRTHVGSIDGAVASIDNDAKSITGLAKSIRDRAASIDTNAAGISGTVKNIAASAGDINGTAKGIDGNFSAILGVAKSIDGRLVDATAKVEAILAIARNINADLTNILAHVGREHEQGGKLTIHGHANAIDCSSNPALVGRSEYCNK